MFATPVGGHSLSHSADVKPTACAGTLKLTMPTAFTTTMLAWGILAFPSAYQQAGEMQHATDSLRWGTDYLLKLYTPSSTTNTTKTSHQYNIIYQVSTNPPPPPPPPPRPPHDCISQA